jgi:hypothetical protein
MSADKKPITVSQTSHRAGLFDLPRLGMQGIEGLHAFTAFVNMTADPTIGGWVAYSAKVAAVYLKDDVVANIKTASGDLITINSATQKASLKTTTGATYDVDVRVPKETGRKLGFYFVYSVPFVVYGLITTGVPGLGLKPGINLYKVWGNTMTGYRGADLGDGIYKGTQDWF